MKLLKVTFLLFMFIPGFCLAKTNYLTIDRTCIQVKNERKQDGYDIYSDYFDNDFIYDNGMLIGYLRNINLSKSLLNSDLSKRDVKDESVKYLKMISNERLSNYIYSDSYYNPLYDTYQFVYTKYVNDIPTNDDIQITLSSTGELYAFSASHQGLYDDLKTDMTSTKVIELINKEFYNRNVTVDYYQITKIDSNYCIEVSVIFRYDDYTESDRYIIYI